jgi:hypothetical protein
VDDSPEDQWECVSVDDGGEVDGNITTTYQFRRYDMGWALGAKPIPSEHDRQAGNCKIF